MEDSGVSPNASPSRRRRLWLNARRLRVLVVQPDVSTCRLFKNILASWECDVEAVVSARAADEAMEQGHYDLLLSELNLPDGSGVDLMHHWRATGHHSGVAVANLPTSEDLRTAQAAGYSGCLVKPFHLAQLEDCIRAALESESSES